MIKKLTTVIISKESVIVFILFLFFQFFRTQTFNLCYILFDKLFLNSIISDIYSFNYKGRLLGCEQLLKLNGYLDQMDMFEREGIYFFTYIPSLIAFLILFIEKVKNKIMFWILLSITCFSILDSIIIVGYLKNLSFNFESIKYVRHFISSIIFIVIGITVLFKVCNLNQRIMIIIIALPAFLIGDLIWFRWLGPIILPVMV